MLNALCLNAIQTMCPRVLHCLTTAVITNKDVRKCQKVKRSGQSYSTGVFTCKDQLQSLLNAYVNFVFDGTQKNPMACESVLVNDFFGGLS